jgi:FKBP-type peptidyl-prolyl cis-trans isomerase FkpA
MPLSDSSASYITTESGLQYRVIEEGNGDKPVASSVVSVHYTGCFENGEEFDSSHKRNAPTTFPLGGVIPGWTEGVQLMAVGAIFQFIIPHDLAYGEAGFGDVIPPLETLYFEIELISFQ